MTDPYDHDALWLKTKLFLNLAMDSDGERTFEERALWASLALELLAKFALARVSPLLIATPQEDGTNLLIAAGLMNGSSRFRSIPAHTLFGRCHKAFKPFNEKEAMLFAESRNDFLHGAGLGFGAVPEDAWWARYWAQVVILLDHSERDLDGLVGFDRVDIVEKYLALNAKNLERRLEGLLERARRLLERHQVSNPPDWVEREFSRFSSLSAGLSHRSESTCPACGADGVLEGEEASNYEIRTERVSDEDYDSWVELTVDADYFSCENCRLVLDGYELLSLSGLPVAFGAVGDYSDYAEGEYGND
ncbi:hypothetical protein ACX801_12780 [Arthrobacter bambusae]